MGERRHTRAMALRNTATADLEQHLPVDLLELPRPWLRLLLVTSRLLSKHDKRALMATCRSACALVLGWLPKCQLHMQVRECCLTCG